MNILWQALLFLPEVIRSSSIAKTCCESASFVDPESDSILQYDDDPDPDPTSTFTHIEKSGKNFDFYFQQCQHRLKMELDLQSLFGLLCTAVLIWLRPLNLPPSPCIWALIRERYWSAKTDDI